MVRTNTPALVSNGKPNGSGIMARFGWNAIWSNKYGVLAAALAFSLYLLTLAPTVMWYDMGEFALVSHVLGGAHPPGYPLYIILGKLFTLLPIGDVAYRVNLMSAAWGSATVYLLFLILKMTTRSDFASFLPAMTVAVGSTFWSSAIWAEAHTLNAFLTLLIIYLMSLWRSTGDFRLGYLAFFILGLGLGNHRLILMISPAAVFFLLLELGRRIPILFWKPLLLLVLFVFVGSLINLYLPFRALQGAAIISDDPGSVDGFIRVALVSAQSGSVSTSLSEMLDQSVVLWAFTRYDFAIPALGISILGAASLARHDRPFLTFTLVPVLLTAFTIVIYNIHDIYYYFIPIFLMLAIWLGFGIAEMEHLLRAAVGRFVGAGVRAYACVTTVYAVRAAWLILPISLVIGNLPLLDRSNDYEANDFAVNTLTILPPNAALLADWWAFWPIAYQQIVEGLRRDVLATYALSSQHGLDEWIENARNQGRPIFVAEGLTDTVDEELGRYTFMTVAPGAIVIPASKSLPRPEYKDLLLKRRDLRLLTSEAPSLLIDEFPEGLEGGVDFEGPIRLAGLVLQSHSVIQGGSLWLDYYWETLGDLPTDLYMNVFFVDAFGQPPLKQGYPVWFQVHELGANVFPTSQWAPGDKVRESYLSIVPRQVPPGRYDLLARLFESDDQTRILSGGTGDQWVILGRVTVTERK